jgi:hypothetical protein
MKNDAPGTGVFGVLEQLVDEVCGIAVELLRHEPTDIVKVLSATSNVAGSDALVVTRHGSCLRLNSQQLAHSSVL